MFVRGVVIEDEMQGPIRGRLRIDGFEKLQPLIAPAKAGNQQ